MEAAGGGIYLFGARSYSNKFGITLDLFVFLLRKKLYDR